MSDASPPPDNPMPPNPPGDGSNDCFAPPKEPCECYCLHCHRVFMSDGIWFQKIINSNDPGPIDGFWMCPTPNCSGAGFTFDIFPTDPNHPANEGWSDEDDEVYFDEDELEEEVAAEYDPNEPKYAELDEQYGDDDDDIEGEEWKHGLAPGERPPDPPWVEEARRRWQEEQAKYDAPDERPRVLDWSDRPKPPPRPSGPPGAEISDDDIPF